MLQCLYFEILQKQIASGGNVVGDKQDGEGIRYLKINGSVESRSVGCLDHA